VNPASCTAWMTLKNLVSRPGAVLR
jgi:hypothetical protein